jgi:hypothetical protein
MTQQSEAEKDLRDSLGLMSGASRVLGINEEYVIQRLLDWHSRHSQGVKVSRAQVFNILCAARHDEETGLKTLENNLMALIEGKQGTKWCEHWKYDGTYKGQPWKRADGVKSEYVRLEAQFCHLCGAKRPAE